jgi:putative solute:sodium symporter small subunit
MASTDAGAGGGAPPTRLNKAEKDRKHQRDNLTVMVSLLAVWFAVSYGAGILFRDVLDQFSVGTAPMGFWFAQQGSIFVFVALIFVYHALMTRIERKYDAEE